MSTPSIISGSITIFNNSSSPIGWTKLTTDNDCAVRVTSGSVGTGGTRNFSSVFTAISGSATITVTGLSASASTAGSPSHFHGSSQGGGTYQPGGGTGTGWPRVMQTTTNTSSVGGGAAHTHSVAVPSTLSSGVPTSFNINMGIKYIDMIVAQRD